MKRVIIQNIEPDTITAAELRDHYRDNHIVVFRNGSIINMLVPTPKGFCWASINGYAYWGEEFYPTKKDAVNRFKYLKIYCLESKEELAQFILGEIG